MTTPVETTPARETVSPIRYEVIQPATEAAWKSYLQPFLKQEKALFKEKYPVRLPNDPDFIAHRDHVALIEYSQKAPFEYGKPDLSYLAVAKQGSEVVGLAYLIVDEAHQIPTSFVAVGWNHLKQGIATELTRLRLKHLKQLGITEGQVSVWDGSAAIYRKLVQTGELANFTPDPQDEAGQVYRFQLTETT